MIRRIITFYTKDDPIPARSGSAAPAKTYMQNPQNCQTLITLLSLLVRSCTTTSYKSRDVKPPFALQKEILVHLDEKDRRELFAGLNDREADPRNLHPNDRERPGPSFF